MTRQGHDEFGYTNEFAAAVAASAHAIHSFEEPANFHNQIRIEENARQEGFIRPSQAGSFLRNQSGIDSFLRPATNSFGESSRQRKKEISSLGLKNLNANADGWERAQIAKIQKKYEKLHMEIVAWENKKKLNEKNQMERKKNELDQRKFRNLKHYQMKMARINEIANTARTQIEDERKHKESIVKAKARKMRSTRKLTFKYCICF